MGPFGRRNRLPIDLRHIEIPIHDAEGMRVIPAADISSQRVEISDSVTLIHGPYTKQPTPEAPAPTEEVKPSSAETPKKIITIDSSNSSSDLRPLSSYSSIEKVLPENSLATKQARLKYFLGRVATRAKGFFTAPVATEPTTEQRHSPRHLNRRRVAYVAAGLAVVAAVTALLSQGGRGAESLEETSTPTDPRAAVSQTLTQAPPPLRVESPVPAASVTFAVNERRTMTDVIDKYADTQGVDFNGAQNYAAYLALERALGMNMLEDAAAKAYLTTDGEVRLKKHQDRTITLTAASQKIINSLITAS